MPDDPVARLLAQRQALSARLTQAEDESELDRLADERRALDQQLLDQISASNHSLPDALLLEVTLFALIPNIKRDDPIWRPLREAINRARERH